MVYILEDKCIWGLWFMVGQRKAPPYRGSKRIQRFAGSIFQLLASHDHARFAGSGRVHTIEIHHAVAFRALGNLGGDGNCVWTPPLPLFTSPDAHRRGVLGFRAGRAGSAKHKSPQSRASCR